VPKRSKKSVPFESDKFAKLAEGLSHLYKEKILPLEDDFLYHRIHNHTPITHGDFSAKPMILLLGQYSVGKSSFIKYFMQREYPGMRIGPEPTTDKFIWLFQGEEDAIFPGQVAVGDPLLPFTQLPHVVEQAFFDRFEAVQCSSPVLEGVTFIDTPGILSGEKQNTSHRGYDFEKVTQWFADRSDMIILLFDTHSLDFSDEMSSMVEKLKGNYHKTRIVLNKANQVSVHQLLRVYGALMWSLGKAVGSSEALHVYIGSFIVGSTVDSVFEKDEKELCHEISNLPKNASTRRTNDLIKRARTVRANACIVNHLRANIHRYQGGLFRKRKQAKFMKKMPEIYLSVSQKYRVPIGDFPDAKVYIDQMKDFDFSTITKVDDNNLEEKLAMMDELLEQDIPQIINRLPQRLSQLPPQHELANLRMPATQSPAVVFATEGESNPIADRDTTQESPLDRDTQQTPPVPMVDRYTQSRGSRESRYSNRLERLVDEQRKHIDALEQSNSRGSRSN